MTCCSGKIQQLLWNQNKAGGVLLLFHHTDDVFIKPGQGVPFNHIKVKVEFVVRFYP